MLDSIYLEMAGNSSTDAHITFANGLDENEILPKPTSDLVLSYKFLKKITSKLRLALFACASSLTCNPDDIKHNKWSSIAEKQLESLRDAIKASYDSYCEEDLTVNINIDTHNKVVTLTVFLKSANGDLVNCDIIRIHLGDK